MFELVNSARCHPVLHLVTVTAITAIFGLGLLRLEVRTDGKTLHPIDHPTVRQNEADRVAFHEPEQVILLISSARDGPAMASPEGLRYLKQCHEGLAALGPVRSSGLISVVTLVELELTPGILSVGRLLDRIPDHPREFDALIAKVRDHPMADGLLLSNDGQAAAIYVPKAANHSRTELIAGIERWMNSRPEARFERRLMGPLVAEATLGRAVLRDLGLLIPVMVLVMAILLFLSLRSVNGVLITMAEVGAVLIWTLGAMGYARVPITLITTLLPVILMTMAVTEEIHLLERLQAHLAQSHDNGEAGPRARLQSALLASFEDVGRPMVLTALTTSIGFLSFLPSSIAPLRQFGLWTAFGILAAMILSFTLVPALAMVLPTAWFRTRRAARHGSPLLPYERWLTRNSARACLLGTVLVAASAPGLAGLSIRDSWIDNFDPDSALASAERLFNAAFWGSYRFDVVFEAPPEYFYSPEGTALIEDFQQVASAEPGVRGVTTFLSITGVLAEALGAGPSMSSLPPAVLADTVTLAKMAADPYGLLGFISPDGALARGRIFLQGSNYERDLALQIALDRTLLELTQGRPVAYHFSGDIPVGLAMIRAIVDNQLRSLTLVLLAIALLLLLVFRSATSALIALVPVSTATLVLFAGMGYLRAPLGVATSMFACLTLGAGVDFAVHFCHAYQRESGPDRGHQQTIRAMLASAGRAIRWNAVVLALGFSVLGLSSLRPNYSLAILLACGMLTCYLMTLLFLPYLLAQRRSTAGSSMRRSGAPALLWLLLGAQLGCGPRPATDRSGEREAIPDLAIFDQSDQRLAATSLMTSIENDLRRTPRIEKMELATRYRRTEGRLDKRPDQDLTLWGIFSDAEHTYRVLYVFVEPRHMRGTALLLEDHRSEATPDSIWIYLSSIGHFNKIQNRGLRLLIPGTALTYEDSRRFLAIDNYEFRLEEGSRASGNKPVVVARPQTPAIESDLGYASLLLDVDERKKLVNRIEYRNASVQSIKTYEVLESTMFDGLWWPEKTRIEHHLEGMVTSIHHRYWPLAEAPSPEFYEPGVDGVLFLPRLIAFLQDRGIEFTEP